MERIDIKALLMGVATDIGGTIIAGMIIFPIFAGDALSEHMSPVEMEEAVRVATQKGAFLITSLIVGLGLTALGGYVAARVAKKELYLHAGLVGVVSLLIGLFFGGEGPFWFEAAGFILVIPAALYGGYFADQQAAV